MRKNRVCLLLNVPGVSVVGSSETRRARPSEPELRTSGRWHDLRELRSGFIELCSRGSVTHPHSQILNTAIIRNSFLVILNLSVRLYVGTFKLSVPL